MATSLPPLSAAADAVSLARSLVDTTAHHLAGMGPGRLDANQAVAYDLAHGAAAVETARAALGYGAHGPLEASLACAFAAEAIWDLAGRVLGREEEWGVGPDALDGALDFVRAWRKPEVLASLATTPGPNHLDGDFELVAGTFRRFAEDRIAPVAEHIHRRNEDIPEDIIRGLGELGAFGLSIPEEYGGFASGGEHDYMGMVIATEELSRGSLGAGGSLITRPEILARALLKGGTEEQKQRWLPKLATGEIMAGVSVTEPDFGSDVAGITLVAAPDGDDWVLSGTKTWSTFAARADVLMVLARTDPDRSKGHRGLSVFVVPKERADGHGFRLAQPGGGRLEGRPIDTIGYRGMHSYELSFDRWQVPGDHLIGGPAGAGRGFYLQMEGFENGRLQTAARAVGVMQAAYEAARAYAEGRVVFGQPIAAYQLTQVKLGRMAAIICAARQYMYEVARLMAKGEGALEASMIKAYVCRAAEWVAREAMQIHGGMGYAEEYPVSRLFVDARVLSIFEGADETLALKVVARRLVDAARS
ncbi:MAG TPA: acyl-CoA dehydrogenase family protein [Acidimicrobiales bacterium]|jgi:(2S)-methylsuccinyl-CoA dehydrogenase|nr:acyl-CoA dehydrogenase family protein [Acidimicrobiales bacterium]